MMRYVVSYDISNDTRRRRLARLLGRHGSRVQRSVFECELDERKLEQLSERIRDEITGSERGNVRVYRICGRCESRAFGLGAVDRPDEHQAFVSV